MKKINKDFVMDLERERLDQSYKNRVQVGPTEYTKIIYRDKAVDHRFRDNIMFNYGRFMEGARDIDAINASKLATNLIKNKRK